MGCTSSTPEGGNAIELKSQALGQIEVDDFYKAIQEECKVVDALRAKIVDSKEKALQTTGAYRLKTADETGKVSEAFNVLFIGAASQNGGALPAGITFDKTNFDLAPLL